MRDPSGEMFQAFLDKKSGEWEAQRATTQLTLGKLIETLKALPQDRTVQGLGALDSYRGYLQWAIERLQQQAEKAEKERAVQKEQLKAKLAAMAPPYEPRSYEDVAYRRGLKDAAELLRFIGEGAKNIISQDVIAGVHREIAGLLEDGEEP
jgi:hypothetical protein